MEPNPLYPVHERFSTWQGEGVHMGRAAFFIRLFGCPMHCPWCDSAGTWHPDYIPAKIERLSVSQLMSEAMHTRASIVVITGGEPAIHDLTPLTAALRAAGVAVHLETSGAFALRGHFDWITLSPKNKWAKPALRENIAAADEFKLILEHPGDIDYWVDVLAGPYRGQPIWLHPEWSKRDNATLLNAITDYIKRSGDPFRAGWQLHKLYRSDALDNRSAKQVPLGGDPSKGF